MGKNKKKQSSRKPGQCSKCGILVSEHVGRTGKYCDNRGPQDFLKDSERRQNKDPSEAEMAGKRNEPPIQIDEDEERDISKEGAYYIPESFCRPGRGRGRGRARGRGSRNSSPDRRPGRDRSPLYSERGLLGAGERLLGDPETESEDSAPENIDEMRNIYRGLRDVVGELADQVKELRIDVYHMKKDKPNYGYDQVDRGARNRREDAGRSV